MVELKDRDLVGLCLYVPRPVRTRFAHLARTHGVSVRAVLQGFMSQFDAAQAKAFAKALAAAQVAAARVLRVREGGAAAA